MTKPAALSRSDLAVKLLARLMTAGVLIVLTSVFLLPGFTVSLAYGVCTFLLANLFFAFYAFRYKGASSGSLMVKAFAQGLMVKMAVFVLCLLAVFKLDPRTHDIAQTAAIFLVIFLMQLIQIALATHISSEDAKRFRDDIK